MTKSKRFSLGQILSITTRRSYIDDRDSFIKIWEFIDYMIGEHLARHELPYAANYVERAIFNQIDEIPIKQICEEESKIIGREKRYKWFKNLKYNEYYNLRPCTKKELEGFSRSPFDIFDRSCDSNGYKR